MTDTDRVVLDQIISETKKEIASEMDYDEFFEFFCVQNVLSDYQLESEQIQTGLVGVESQLQTGSDGVIDAIYVLVNGRFVRDAAEAESLKNTFKKSVVIEVVLIQASTEKGFKLQRLLRFQDTMEDIFSLERTAFSENYNQGLREAIETFRALHRAFATKHASVRVSYFYVTKGDTPTISNDVLGLKGEIESKAKKVLATIKECTVTFIGARELVELANSTPKVSHPLRCSDSISPTHGGACVALVPLGEYVKFLTDEKGALRTGFFEATVIHDRIIEATNSQTRMAPSSLWATRPIHRDIETVFRAAGLYYDRRKTSYRRKGIPLANVVGISELAQSVGAILLQEPDHARAPACNQILSRKR